MIKKNTKLTSLSEMLCFAVFSTVSSTGTSIPMRKFKNMTKYKCCAQISDINHEA